MEETIREGVCEKLCVRDGACERLHIYETNYMYVKSCVCERDCVYERLWVCEKDSESLLTTKNRKQVFKISLWDSAYFNSFSGPENILIEGPK